MNRGGGGGASARRPLPQFEDPNMAYGLLMDRDWIARRTEAITFIDDVRIRREVRLSIDTGLLAQRVSTRGEALLPIGRSSKSIRSETS